MSLQTRLQLIRNARGLTVVEALATVAMIGVVTMALLSLEMQMNIRMRDTSSLNQLDIFRRGLSANLWSDAAWTKTKSAYNPELNDCLTSPSCKPKYTGFNSARTFKVFNALPRDLVTNKDIYYDSTVGSNGVDSAGKQCNTFNFNNIDIRCPFRYDLRWFSTSTAAKPIIHVYATLMIAKGKGSTGANNIAFDPDVISTVDLNRYSLGICAGQYSINAGELRCTNKAGNNIIYELLRVP